jgi:hypothetical protein
VPEEIRRTVHFHPVATMDEALALVLKGAVGHATEESIPAAAH